jgi:hypothetical protein
MGSLFLEEGKYKKSVNKLKKGENFRGSVGELVAPTVWKSFVTTAGLFALDRADSSFRRVKKEKKNTMTGGKHGAKSRRDKRIKFREIMGWIDLFGETTNRNGKLIGTYPPESIMDYIIVEVKSKKYDLPISNELYNELYEKAIKAQEFRTIVDWDEINGYPYNNSRNRGNKYVEYPDEFIIDYIIEKVREREYKIPLTKKLFKELYAEAQRILNERNRVAEPQIILNERNRTAEVSISQANNYMRTALQQMNSRKVNSSNSSNSSFSNLGSKKNSSNSANSAFSRLSLNSPFSNLG